MKARTAESGLLWLLLGMLILAIVALSLGYYRQQYHADEYQSLVSLVLSQFAPPLSTVLGSYFALKRAKKEIPLASSYFYVAFAATLLWCLLVSGRTAAFALWPTETVQVLSTWLNQIPSLASYLVTGVIAYFFVAAPKSTRATSQ